jgi:NADH dehydrogenase
MSTSKRIVIVGTGFGGLAAAKALAGKACEVTLVDRSNHHLFQPLLYQVATAMLSPADIATATRTIIRAQNLRIVMAEVIGVDVNKKRLLTKTNDDLPYDYLVLATGADYSFFGNDEWALHAPVLKSLEDALTIREKLLSNFEQAERSKDVARIQELLTFIVVGAGPTGVEMAGAVAELAKTALTRDFKSIDTKHLRILLVEAGSTALSAFPEGLSSYAVQALRTLGVEVHLGRPVKAITDSGIMLGNTWIASNSVIWCAGTQARPAATWIGAEAARNKAIIVNDDCSVPGNPEIFAIGDVACYQAGLNRPLPGIAPVAKQQGAYVAKAILARIQGKSSAPPFKYRNWGTMAVIGRSHAVADFGKIRLKGFTGWLAWSLVHLLLLIDFRSRTSVYLNWSWAWFTRGRSARLLTGVQRKKNPPSNADYDYATESKG